MVLVRVWGEVLVESVERGCLSLGSNRAMFGVFYGANKACLKKFQAE